jgi:branched-subunit amino acid aminotransferase/4-amino-4-deoxychorismate lyase
VPCVCRSVRVFRPQENAKRLKRSAERLLMAPFPEEKFVSPTMEPVIFQSHILTPKSPLPMLYMPTHPHATIIECQTAHSAPIVTCRWRR